MLTYLTTGESHGPELTLILEGIPAGLPLTPENINPDLARRQRGAGSGDRMNIEHDQAIITAGVMDGQTTGAPIAIRILNKNHEQWRGKEIPPFTKPRPGHADLTGAIKYGYRDLRPALERASARETAARVAMGAICKHFLAQFEITVGGWVAAIGEINAAVEIAAIPLPERLTQAEESPVRCPSPSASQAMESAIRQAKEDGDTLGGIIEVIALYLPPGLGSHVHWERRLDSRLGAALLSIPAIKGLEIGPAFQNARLPGTQAHDSIRKLEDGSWKLEVGNQRSDIPNTQYPISDTQYPTPNSPPASRTSHLLTRPSNRAGGLEGGITTGQPLHLRAAMKPIATTLTSQPTVDLADGAETITQYERSDVCPVPRAVPILEAMTAYVLADALLEKLGGDSLAEILPRYQTLRRAALSDLPMDDHPHTWWPDD